MNAPAAKLIDRDKALAKAIARQAGLIGGSDARAKALMRRALRAFQRRQVWFPLKAGAEAIALETISDDLMRRLQKLTKVMPGLQTADAALRAASHLVGKQRAEFRAALDRLPTDFFLSWVDELRTRYATCRNAADRAAVVQRAVDELNEMTALFHPELIRRYGERARSVAAQLNARPQFRELFKIESDTPQILRFVKAPGVKGSVLPTRSSVDGLPVLVLTHRDTGVRYYLMLGDVQVKSFNVSELVVGEGGRPGQLVRDRLRKGRGLDIAIFSPEGMTIPRERLIDPTQHGVAADEVGVTVLGQRALTASERKRLARRRIRADDVVHDVSTTTSREMALELVKLFFPVVPGKKKKVAPVTPP